MDWVHHNDTDFDRYCCPAQDLNLTEISSDGLRSFHSMVFLLQELGVIGLFSWIKE